jgi:LmbE family N-acetylglucosaminyl deacetylase
MSVAVTADGLPVATWAKALAEAPRRSLAEVVPRASTRLVVVGAHPDDETIGAGRLVAEWARTRGPVLAVTLTAGEACLDEVGVEEPDLAERRLREWRTAVDLLGAEPGPHGLCPDGAVAAHADVMAAALAAELAPGDTVLTPWRHDPHPDHEAAGRVAAVAARERGATLLEYPVWMPYWMPPDTVAATGDRCSVVVTGAEAERAREGALAAYVSQREPLRPGLGPVVPPLLLAHHHAQLVLG